MSENSTPGTQDNMGDNQTDTSQVSTTDQQAQSGASQDANQSGQSETVSLSQEDYRNLVSQRDKNFSEKQSLEERVQQIENNQSKGQFLDTWLQENTEKYPNVTREDLDMASSPDDVEAIARFAERKYEDAKQKALEEIQKVDAPQTMTKEEFAEREQDLRKQADEGNTDAFDKWIQAQSQVN